MCICGLNLHDLNVPGFVILLGAPDRINCKTTLEGPTCHPGCMVFSQITLIKNSTQSRIYKHAYKEQFIVSNSQQTPAGSVFTKIQTSELEAITLKYIWFKWLFKEKFPNIRGKKRKIFKRSSKLKVELLQVKIRASEVKGAADVLNSRIDMVEERIKLLQNES